MEIGCVLLCSGYGRRFGSNKLLALLDGVPLYRRAFSALPPALFTKAVVTSQYGEILAQAGKLGYLPLLNCHPWRRASGWASPPCGIWTESCFRSAINQI